MNVIVHKFNVLNGFDREKNSDLKAVTECGQKVTCHKVVVAAVSTKLSALLGKRPTDELSFRNVKFTALENVVNFVYNGKVQILNAGDLQDFADVYAILKINLGKKVGDIVNRLGMNKSDSDLENTSQELVELKCENCQKTFKSKKQLVRHVREVHRQEPPNPKQSYACEKCGVLHTVRKCLHFIVYNYQFPGTAFSAVL